MEGMGLKKMSENRPFFGQNRIPKEEKCGVLGSAKVIFAVAAQPF